MREYALTVFILCVTVGALGRISYGAGKDISRPAISVVILYFLISPLVGIVCDLDFNNIPQIDDIGGFENSDSYIDVAEDSFAEGIVRAIEEKFSLERGSVRVTLSGFDFKEMRAETITVYLEGRSVAADYPAIERYVDSMGIGKCEVKIKIG